MYVLIFVSYAIFLLKEKKRSGQSWQQPISSLLPWLGSGSAAPRRKATLEDGAASDSRTHSQ